jgi:CheY-like chemotaxis protein
MNYKLLLVEDDQIFTFLLKKAIKKIGLSPITGTFINGLEALEYLKAAYSSEENYVIFLDLNMPIMNGWEFLRRLSNIARPSNCIVFVLTSSNYQKDLHILEENAFVLDYVTKPISESTMKGLKETIALKLWKNYKE